MPSAAEVIGRVRRLYEKHFDWRGFPATKTELLKALADVPITLEFRLVVSLFVVILVGLVVLAFLR